MIAKTVIGVKQPQIENESTIKKWLQQQGLDQLDVYTVDPARYYEFSMFYPNKRLIYSNSGDFLSIGFGNGKFCPKNFDDYLLTTKPYPLLNPKPDNYLIVETLNTKGIKMHEAGKSITKLFDEKMGTMQTDTIYPKIDQLNTFIRDFKGNKAFIRPDRMTDYILVMSCAKFYGNRIQLNELVKYYKAALKNNTARFKVVLLNFDKQEWWGKEWIEKINISV